MPKYLFEAHYSADGAKGVVKEGGTLRRAAVARMAESVGGKLESFYFAFGGVDAYATIDLPDNASAAAVALAVSQAGAASDENGRPPHARGDRRGWQEGCRLSAAGPLTPA